MPGNVDGEKLYLTPAAFGDMTSDVFYFCFNANKKFEADMCQVTSINRVGDQCLTLPSILLLIHRSNHLTYEEPYTKLTLNTDMYGTTHFLY